MVVRSNSDNLCPIDHTVAAGTADRLPVTAPPGSVDCCI